MIMRKNKGLCFYLNIALWATGIFLIIPFFLYGSSNQFILGYSLKYLVFLTLAAGMLVLFGAAVFCGGRLLNRTIFAAVLSILLISELANAFLKRYDQFSKDINFYPSPYTMFSGRPNGVETCIDKSGVWGGGRIDIKLDDLGFRTEAGLSAKKKPGEFRIFVVGASSVFNGYPLSNGISGQLEALFHKEGRAGVKVYNCGVVGYLSGQELSLIMHTLIDYEPDLIIVYDGSNDIAHPYTYDPRPGYPFNFMVYESGISFIRNEMPWQEAFLIILNRSALVRVVFKYPIEYYLLHLNGLRRGVNYGSGEWEEAVIRKYSGNLKKMCRLAEGCGFKLAVFLQPVIYLKSPLTKKERRLLAGGDFQQYVARQYKRASVEFGRLEERYNQGGRCFFFDTSREFQNYDGDAFWDFVHLNNKGNRYIAEKIYTHVKEILR